MFRRQVFVLVEGMFPESRVRDNQHWPTPQKNSAGTDEPSGRQATDVCKHQEGRHAAYALVVRDRDGAAVTLVP